MSESVTEAGSERRDRLEELGSRIREIETQLASRDVRDETGSRLDSVAFWRWRQKAIYAKTKMTEEYRQLKREIHEEQNAWYGGELARVTADNKRLTAELAQARADLAASYKGYSRLQDQLQQARAELARATYRPEY